VASRTAFFPGNEPEPPGVVRDGTSTRTDPDRRGHAADLSAALRSLRDALRAARFPLETDGASAARHAAAALLAQLDEYLMPRAARLDAPLVAVVGGSTGAGKSTLVNSLVRAPVSRAGVLRPTTRGPVLVCHPADGTWFGGHPLLSGLGQHGSADEGELRVVSAPLLQPGLALLDAPDIDSVVARNRELAHELLAAADLWLFVTTAARYADAVPWRVLRSARDRGTVVAVVLDRVPPPVRDEVAADLSRLLSEQGLPAAPLFVVDESTVDGQGLLPEDQVAPVAAYLTEVASSELRRRAVGRRTLLGAITAATATADELAFAAMQQGAVADALAATVREAYHRASQTAAEQIALGAAMRGAAYARWRASVASGEVARVLRVVQDPAKARPSQAPPGRALQGAIATALAALLVEAEAPAEEAIVDRWSADPAGRSLLGAPDDDTVPDDHATAAREVVRDWQAWLRNEARLAAPNVRTRTRGTTTAATVVLATVAAAATPEMGSGEGEPGRGSAADALRRVLTDPTIARLAGRARDDLLDRVRQHFAARSLRWLRRVDAQRVEPSPAPRLRQAAADVGVARQLALVLGKAA
jgi:hypothetical protein